MAKACSHLKIRIDYPRHWPAPEDLLDFIESTEFTAEWARLGLDADDDLASLQLCIMASPDGDGVIAGSGGLRVHRHCFQRAGSVKAVTVWYGYFPDFGVVYLNCLESGQREFEFSQTELAAISAALREVEIELERIKVIRVMKRSVENGGADHG